MANRAVPRHRAIDRRDVVGQRHWRKLKMCELIGSDPLESEATLDARGQSGKRHCDTTFCDREMNERRDFQAEVL